MVFDAATVDADRIVNVADLPGGADRLTSGAIGIDQCSSTARSSSTTASPQTRAAEQSYAAAATASNGVLTNSTGKR